MAHLRQTKDGQPKEYTKDVASNMAGSCVHRGQIGAGGTKRLERLEKERAKSRRANIHDESAVAKGPGLELHRDELAKEAALS